LKLLVVSHSCCTPINQQIYADVEQLTGWKLTLVVPSNWKNEYGKIIGGERWPAFKGDVLPVPTWRSGDVILHAYKTSFSRLLREVSPDVIYVNHEPYAVATAQVFLANRRLRKPIGFYSCQNISKRYPPPFRWTEAMVLRRSSFFFPISIDVETVFRNKGYAGRSAVLPLGVDLSVYHPRPEAVALKQRLGPEGQVLIGYVGRLVPEKGLSTLLKALATIRDLPWQLVIVGAGPFAERFDAEAVALGISSRITHAGYIPHEQAPEYLSAFDLLVLPSETQPNWKEQFGRVVIEAMACGTPVVGSDSGEIPNLIADTGGGLVFKERQPNELADRLARLIRDPALRAGLGAKGQQAAAARYSLAAIARKFAATVEAAVAKKTGTDDL
jgi:glycosyltransferase involved in cell wall biosynthesis